MSVEPAAGPRPAPGHTTVPTTGPTTGPTRVLYVAGTGRSGSTVLANLLGGVDGWVSVGEMRFVWERGQLQDRLCGCGASFSACPWWGEVLDLALGPGTGAQRRALAERMHAELTARTRLRTLPTHVVHQRARVSLRPDGELEHLTGRLYAAAAAVARASVVVDSSKLPTYAAVLDALEDVEPRVVHLVRDPRAAAYSWTRVRAQPDLGAGALMERRGAWKSAALWLLWNRGMETLVPAGCARYVRLTYEDLLAQPREQLDRVLRTLGLDGGDLGALLPEPGVARLGVHHTVAGNPARMRSGLVPLTLDDEWRRSMPQGQQRAVTALTRGTLRRYGYRLRPGAPGR